jgi:hypothetical protein
LALPCSRSGMAMMVDGMLVLSRGGSGTDLGSLVSAIAPSAGCAHWGKWG